MIGLSDASEPNEDAGRSLGGSLYYGLWVIVSIVYKHLFGRGSESSKRN